MDNKLTEENEKAFMNKYKTCAYNFHKMVLDYGDTVIETMKESPLHSFQSKEDFERFAVRSMLRAAKFISKEQTEMYRALDAAKNLLDND